MEITQKLCNRCYENLPTSEYWTRKRGLMPNCKACSLKIQAEYRARNPDKRKIEGKQYHKKHALVIRLKDKERYQKLRFDAILHYSNNKPKCACPSCGETILRLLVIDHVNGNGNKHRKEIGTPRGGKKFYRWLRDNNYPSGFQILCWNCNNGRQLNDGVCPHVAQI